MTGRLTIEPACLPLLHGALPHEHVGPAFELARRAGPILAWPQLPRRAASEQSLTQMAIGFPGVVFPEGQQLPEVDTELARREISRLEIAYLTRSPLYGALAADMSLGLTEVIRQRDLLRDVALLKGHVLGPISAAALLTDQARRPILYDEKLFEALAQHIQLRAAWQERLLRELKLPTLICLDEPLFEMGDIPFFPYSWEVLGERLHTVLDGLEGARGILAGGGAAWPRLLDLPFDVVIITPAAARRASADPAQVAAFLERGGAFGLAICPVQAEQVSRTTPQALVERVGQTARRLVGQAGDVSALLRRCFLTPADTLGTLSVSAAEASIDLLGATSALARQTYG